jgi:hypothetical protein
MVFEDLVFVSKVAKLDIPMESHDRQILASSELYKLYVGR